MLHANDEHIRSLLLKGNFGLERENLRVTREGFLSQTPNPFKDHPNILRDFSECQVEINTGVSDSPQGAIDELAEHDAVVQKTLASLPEPELLWPFSNPPYIRNWKEIPIAQFEGDEASKTAYREYLSDRYGRYKMTFSGIHFNYSFSDELLQADFALSDYDDFVAYKDQLYLDLAQRAVAYGWLMTAVTAASPVMDSSYVEKGKMGEELFLGLSTVRCSELGYWNFFTPILDYSSVAAYAQSIQDYIDQGLIKYPSELYYPIRIKPKGTYGLENIASGDISHIELRMFDLNPLYPCGINVQDVFFGQLFLVWLAGTPVQPFDIKDQVQAAQNFKNASHYDLKTVKIVVPNGEVYSVAHAALNVIGFMEEFFGDYSPEVTECLEFQKAKFTSQETRYANKLRELYCGNYVEKGLKLAEELQQNVADAACPLV